MGGGYKSLIVYKVSLARAVRITVSGKKGRGKLGGKEENKHAKDTEMLGEVSFLRLYTLRLQIIP